MSENPSCPWKKGETANLSLALDQLYNISLLQHIGLHSHGPWSRSYDQPSLPSHSVMRMSLNVHCARDED